MKNYIYKKKTGFLSMLIAALSVYAFRVYLTDTGIGYMICTYLICAFLWMILGNGFSDVMSRMVRTRLSKGQKNNALYIISLCFANQFIFGVLGAVLCAQINYSLMMNIFNFPKGRYLGIYLSAFFFFRMINEYLIGYLSVTSGDRAICIADVLKQLFRIGFGAVCMKYMYDKGLIVASILMDDDYKFIYMASGLFIGFCISEIFIFVFLFIVKLGFKIKGSSDRDPVSMKESTIHIFLNFWNKRIATIIHGSVFCLMLMTVLPASDDISAVGSAFSMLLLPFIISAILSMYFSITAAVQLTSSVRKKEKGNARIYFDYGIHIAEITAVFVTSFAASVSKLYSKLILPEGGNGITTEMIVITAASIPFAVSLFSDQITAMRDDRIPRIIADAVSGILAILAARISFGSTPDIFRSLMISILVYSISGMIIWWFVTYVRMGLVFDPIRNTLIPIVSGAVNAIALLVITNAASPHLGAMFTLLISIPIALIIYHSILLLLRNYYEVELKLMPLGGVLYSLGQILRVM